jgi:shikimate dehydrogenase
VIEGTTRIAGVIGDPVRHSLSPVILNAAFAASDVDAVFGAFEVRAGSGRAAVEAMRALDLLGLSVTMPHKADVVDAVDRCTAEAEALGAVNCIAWEGSDLVGHNTDGAGFVDALRADAGFEFSGSSVAVIGAGGAARAVVLAVAQAGAAVVAVVNRTPDRAVVAAGLAGAAGVVGGSASVRAADLVVNATPVGMGQVGMGQVGMRGGGGLPVDPEQLQAGQVVVDLVYNPLRTPLLAAAEARGATTVDGLGMLVHQAGHAFRHWTGREPPLEAMTGAARSALSRNPPKPQRH